MQGRARRQGGVTAAALAALALLLAPPLQVYAGGDDLAGGSDADALDLPAAATATAAPPRRRGRRARTDAITVFGRRQRAAQQPGAAARIDRRELERHRHDDAGRVLREVPGVVVRDEDGWGLRPNIGMRGANPERSTKIALMEDGVPAAPAPYAAPAAYYFPLMLRIERVEVLKGPAAIRYGPNAIGGALNLVSAGVPDGPRLDAELAGGNTMYGRGLLRLGQRFGAFAVLAEAAMVRSDGFKRVVDGQGDDTDAFAGMVRRDAGLTLGWQGGAGDAHRVALRLGYGDEDSGETYLGQTRADFDADPRQRYLASGRDRMRWNHQSLRLRHSYERGGLQLHTTLYGHRLHRVWDKLDGFAGGPALTAILAAPSAGTHPIFLDVLRGRQDSLSAAETLLMGRNDRTFLAAGLSSELSWQGEAFGLGHELVAGARLHRDDAARSATAHGVRVQGGALVDDGAAERRTVDQVSEVLALSAWLQDTLALGALRLTLGGRVEHTRTEARDVLAGAAAVAGGGTALIPGVGLTYAPRPELVLLAGVFKGFAPVAPGQPAGVRPEQAWNFDLGGRWTGRRLRAELIAFAGLYDNLVGTCSAATGCTSDRVGDQFNGGRASVLGLEASAGALVALPKGLRMPLSLALTLSQARFDSAFDSDNPAWGRVAVGDLVPYIPTLQVSASAGLRRGALDLSLEGRYVAAMRDAPGKAAIGTDPGEAAGTDAIVQVDAALSYRFGRFGTAFVQAQNLTGALPVVSLRPFGARTSLPRLVVVGWRL